MNFGFIYGLAAFGSVTLHTIFSLMAPPSDPSSSQNVASPPSSHGNNTTSHFNSSLTFLRSASVLGYCLLPLVFMSLVGIVVPMDRLFGYIFVSLAVLWCTYSSSAMFCAVGRMAGGVSTGTVLLGLWYHGHLQLQRHGHIGDESCRRLSTRGRRGCPVVASRQVVRVSVQANFWALYNTLQ